ncbi:cytosolic phospholipase A2 gamma-like [Carettochelys insculpta]|uniref:cytosolic phospholipase A2 gamma-like n=1 Tax=Carettochelys insculpta TaxID=44489 RepID=UPI003EBC7CBF
MDGTVWFSDELSDGEKEATRNRKAKVLQCLQNNQIVCEEANTPNIAILGSGGGLRAMIALLGTLTEMQNQGLLDAIMYLCGVSGSTWCMSTLYNYKDWTEKIQKLEQDLCNELSRAKCDITEEFRLAEKAAEDELFSLTDVWDDFFVYTVLNKHDPTKLSEHEGTSVSGTNPYPIYAAIEKTKWEDGQKCSPEIWFEFTPHLSGFRGLGAFVCTKDLGSKFEDGKLVEKREERNIGYLQGLWGSAPGSICYNIGYLIDLIKEKFRRLFEQLGMAKCEAGGPYGRRGPVLLSNTHRDCAHCPVAILLLELYVQSLSEKDCREVFGKMKEALKDQNRKNFHQSLCEAHETWGSKKKDERIAVCLQFIRIFEADLGDIPGPCEHCQGVILFLELHIHGSSVKDSEGLLVKMKEVLKVENSKNSQLMSCEVSIDIHLNALDRRIWELLDFIWNCEKRVSGFVWSISNLLWKTMFCIVNWTWGTTNNFLYRSTTTKSDLTSKEFISLMDAGIALNSAYPLVLWQERKVNLILSFDFSEGDPFETISQTATYCETNQIPFPVIDPKVIEEKDNPSDCYIFGEGDGPTIMHFPLFNKNNCPGEIETFRKKFATSNVHYGLEDINELLQAAKQNVSRNKCAILDEINRIVS